MAKPIKSVFRKLGLASVDAPKVEDPLPMPDPDDKAIERRNMRSMMKRRRGGRVGSIMSGDSGLG